MYREFKRARPFHRSVPTVCEWYGLMQIWDCCSCRCWCARAVGVVQGPALVIHRYTAHPGWDETKDEEWSGCRDYDGRRQQRQHTYIHTWKGPRPLRAQSDFLLNGRRDLPKTGKRGTQQQQQQLHGRGEREREGEGGRLGRTVWLVGLIKCMMIIHF